MTEITNQHQEKDMYKKLLDEEGDLMFHDEEEQTGHSPQKNHTIVGAVAVPVRNRRNGGRGSCFSWPCMCKCALITTLVFVVLSLIATSFAFFWIKDVVTHLTVTTPHDPFPIVHMTDAELDVVKDRMKLFVDQLKSGQADLEDLTITQDEINGFLGHSDYLRGNMLITVSKDKITEQYSLPMEMFPGGKGRYFVGSDYVKLFDVEGESRIEVEMETAAKHEDWFQGPLLFAQLQYLVSQHEDDHDGLHLLELYLKKGSFFGQDAPQDFIEEHKNLLDDFDEDPDNMDALIILDGIESVSIEEGKIVVHPRHHKDVMQEEVEIEEALEEEGERDDFEMLEIEEEAFDTMVENDPVGNVSVGNLRTKDIKKDEQKYVVAKKINGNLRAHKKNHQQSSPSSSSSSSSYSSSSSSDE